MVFFTCNACGASLKKNQVERHYQNECPTCEVLSCMDCGQDFYGDAYANHTKCISEAEKYQGSLYKESGKGGPGKGERKQQEWLEQVKQSVSGAKVSPKVAGLLERIAEYHNIPRKKAKFENFVQNSFNVRDPNTLTQLWDAFSGATKKCQGGQKTSDKAVTEKPNSDGLTEKVDRTNGEISRPVTKKKKHKERGEAVNSTVELDSQESVCLAEVDSGEAEVPKQKRKKKHKEHTEVVADSSEKLDCDKSLVKVNRDEAEIVPKIKKRKHEKRPEISKSIKVQDSDNQEMESFAEVNRDEVKRPRKKKKHQPMEETTSTSINSSASGVDHELGDVDDMSKLKTRKQQDLELIGKNTDAPPSEELNDCDSSVKMKLKKKQRHGLEGSGFEGKGKKRKLDADYDEEAVLMTKCRAVEEVDSDPVNNGASQSVVKKQKKKHKCRKQTVGSEA